MSARTEPAQQRLPIYEGSFEMIPSEIITNQNLDAYAKATFLALLHFEQDGMAWPSYNTLRKIVGCSRDRLWKSIRQLEDEGVVAHSQRTSVSSKGFPIQRSNVFYMRVRHPDRDASLGVRHTDGGSPPHGHYEPDLLIQAVGKSFLDTSPDNAPSEQKKLRRPCSTKGYAANCFGTAYGDHDMCRPCNDLVQKSGYRP